MKRIALIVSFFVVLSGCYYLLTMRKSAETILINPYGTKGAASSSSYKTRAYFKNENGITGKNTITKAINDYQLDELFGADKATLLEKISANLSTNRNDRTYFYYIKAFSDTEEKAQQICYAIVHSYDELLRESVENTRNEVIAKYKQKIEAQEDKVEDLRAKLYKTSKYIGIPYHINHNNSQPISKEKMIHNYSTVKGNSLEILSKDIQDLDGKKLISTILASNRPEAKLLIQHDTKLKDLTRTRENLIASGLGSSHPRIKALDSAIESTTMMLLDSAEQTKLKIHRQLITRNELIEQLRKEGELQSSKKSITAEDHTYFAKIKDEYEREFKILQAIRSSEFRETIASGLEIDPLQISEPGWTPEVEKMMKERKIGNK